MQVGPVLSFAFPPSPDLAVPTRSHLCSLGLELDFLGQVLQDLAKPFGIRSLESEVPTGPVGLSVVGYCRIAAGFVLDFGAAINNPVDLDAAGASVSV